MNPPRLDLLDRIHAHVKALNEDVRRLIYAEGARAYASSDGADLKRAFEEARSDLATAKDKETATKRVLALGIVSEMLAPGQRIFIGPNPPPKDPEHAVIARSPSTSETKQIEALIVEARAANNGTAVLRERYALSELAAQFDPDKAVRDPARLTSWMTAHALQAIGTAAAPNWDRIAEDLV